MSGGSSANNSWTILTPEETVAETLRPLAEGTEDHGESLASAAGSGADHPVERCPVEGQVVSEEQAAQQNGDTSTEQHISMPTTITDASVPTSVEVSRSFVPVSDALSQAEGLPEDLTQSNPDPDSFSDSYTHISTSPDETPVSLLSTETLEGGEFRQEEERLTEEGTLHLQSGKELQQENLGRQTDSPVDAEVGEEKMGKEQEPEVRRRSLLAALEQIRRTEEEEEEEGEEEFQLPRREEDSGFSVNKCILGAVILLGLGTIFFSGLFMDLDEESDYGTRELKDSEVPGKQDWLNPEVPPAPVDADNTEILNKLNEGNQQISVLQAQLQAQTAELKVARGHAAEGAKERLRWEEVEKENSRLKTEMESFSVLQKENRRMKRELESVSALKKELETLRSTVTEFKLSSAAGEATVASVEQTTSPPSGQPETTRQDIPGTMERKPAIEQKEKKKDRNREKYDTGEKKDWKEKEKCEWKEEEKTVRKDVGKTEWKTGKHEQRKFDKEKEKDKEGKQKKHSDETKQQKDKDWKKEKAGRGDEGKPWKAREGKKERMEKSERRESKDEKDWKKAKHDKVNEGKQWRDKEEKRDSKGGNGYGERHRGKEEWKGGKDWKKVKDGFKESGKEKLEKKDWKEKGEKKEWKTKNGKDHDKEGKLKGERKHWEESENYNKERNRKNEWKSRNAKDDKEWKRKGERKQWEKKEEEEEQKRGRQKEKGHGDWKKDRSSSHQHKDEHKFTRNNHHDPNEEHVWGDRSLPHTHRKPSLEQPEYWVQQRDRLQHNRKPPQHCSSLETCAQAEGLLPVPLPEFEAILQNYLAKAEETGVEASVTEELRKLTSQFFNEGVFVHDQMSFQDFVEDVSDILEHMVEGDENEEEEEEEEDSAIEEEMEEFEREVLKKFLVSGAGEKEERIKGEWRKESRQGRG